MILICYMLGYKNDKPVECCGKFRDMEHFKMFQINEEYAGRYVTKITFTKECES